METNQLLMQLAQKLGTTTEYLWSILVNQAPIAATTLLVQTIIVLIFGYFLYRMHIHLSKKRVDSRQNEYKLYWEYEEFASIPMIIGIVIFIILIIICFCSFDSVIYGYFNPEYWALKEILNSLKGCN